MAQAMMMLAQSNLTGNDMKVMCGQCFARLDYENLIQVNQAEGSRASRHESTPCKPFNQEADRARRGLEGVKIGISRSYRLNPNFGWKVQLRGIEALHEHLKIVK